MKQDHEWNRADPDFKQWCITELLGKLHNLTKEIWDTFRNKNKNSCPYITVMLLLCASWPVVAAQRVLPYLLGWFWTVGYFQRRGTFHPAVGSASSGTICAGNRWAACRWSRWEQQWRCSCQVKALSNCQAPPPFFVLCVCENPVRVPPAYIHAPSRPDKHLLLLFSAESSLGEK